MPDVTEVGTFLVAGINFMGYYLQDNLIPCTSGIDYGAFSVKNLAQDLSGTLSGAGGIGGLISVTRNTSSTTETFYPLCDGNGNISDYVDTNGNVVAHKEFDAYGNTIASSGNVNDFNFWFSSKYYDSEINAFYFGRRHYHPVNGRWINRDPIEEDGGINLYWAMQNNTIDKSDPLGEKIGVYCPDDYFKSIGLKKGWYYQSMPYVYENASIPLIATKGDDLEIVWAMLQSDFIFWVKALDVKELKKHVAARRRIVDELNKIDSSIPRRIPGAPSNCYEAAKKIYELSGVISRILRDVGSKWVPGDWGYIANRTYYLDPSPWDARGMALYGGENVIYRGGYFNDFFGYFPPSGIFFKNEKDWFTEIGRWSVTKSGIFYTKVLFGDPVWSSPVRYYGISWGLGSKQAFYPSEGLY